MHLINRINLCHAKNQTHQYKIQCLVYLMKIKACNSPEKNTAAVLPSGHLTENIVLVRATRTTHVVRECPQSK